MRSRDQDEPFLVRGGVFKGPADLRSPMTQCVWIEAGSIEMVRGEQSWLVTDDTLIDMILVPSMLPFVSWFSRFEVRLRGEPAQIRFVSPTGRALTHALAATGWLDHPKGRVIGHRAASR